VERSGTQNLPGHRSRVALRSTRATLAETPLEFRHAPLPRHLHHEARKRCALSRAAKGGMVGRTKRVTKDGIADAQNDVCGYVVVEADSIEAAAKLFENHPHFSIFPGDAVDIMPFVTGPENEP
jgi:hypothetical protein